MEKPRRVLLYGKSVILGTLEASLKRYSQMEVCALSAPFPTVEELKAMAPDVVIFDTASPRPEAAFALLETYPGLLLIGFEPTVATRTTTVFETAPIGRSGTSPELARG